MHIVNFVSVGAVVAKVLVVLRFVFFLVEGFVEALLQQEKPRFQNKFDVDVDVVDVDFGFVLVQVVEFFGLDIVQSGASVFEFVFLLFD